MVRRCALDASVSLRLKLLLLSLPRWSLPWAGCQYAREMERCCAKARAAIAGGRWRRPSPPRCRGAATALPRPRAVRSVRRSASARYDLAPIVPAGRTRSSTATADDWPAAPQRLEVLRPARSDRCGMLTGVHERMLYVLLEVRDDKLVFDAPDAAPLEPATSATASGSASRTPRAPSARCSSPPPRRRGAARGASRRANTVAEAAVASRASRRLAAQRRAATASSCACRCRCSAAARRADR